MISSCSPQPRKTEGHCPNGYCAKKYCSDVKRLEKVKLLYPTESCRSAFRCNISAGRIGKILICLDHFSYVHQKQFIINGSFPENVQLQKIGYSAMKETTPIPTSNIEAKHKGIVAKSHALNHDVEWVQKIIMFLYLHIILLTIIFFE